MFQKGNEYSNAFCNITTVIDNLAIAANLTKNYQKPLKLSGKSDQNKGKLSGNLSGDLNGNLTVEIGQQDAAAVYTPPIPSYILQAREAYMNTIKQTQMNIMHSSRNIIVPPITNTTVNTTPSSNTANNTDANNTVHVSQSPEVASAITPPQHTDYKHEPYLSSLPASFRLDILILFVIQG